MDVACDSSNVEVVIDIQLLQKKCKKNKGFGFIRTLNHQLFVAAKELNRLDAKCLCFNRMSKESYLYFAQLISYRPGYLSTSSASFILIFYSLIFLYVLYAIYTKHKNLRWPAKHRSDSKVTHRLNHSELITNALVTGK